MKLYKYLSIVAIGMSLASCNDFLDATPDSRIEVDNEAEVKALLNTAYPDASIIRLTELASDNADDLNGEENGHYDRFSEQCFFWQPITEEDNENSAMVWERHYAAIAAANHALVAIDKMGGATTDHLKAYRAEALLCRAYAHFMLTNIFGKHYSVAHATEDLGVPYITEPEVTLNPSYERLTVAEDYALIEKDLLEGIELMSDAVFEVPHYHFNSKAAYTFASRFYLFCNQPEKVIKYATLALGDTPEALMRDYDAMQDMPTDNMQPRAMQYASSTEKANFLLIPVYSQDQYYFSGTSMGGRFNNNSYIGQAEQLFITPWMPSNQNAQQTQDMYRSYWFYSQVYNKFLFPKIPNYFEEVNNNTHTGYARTIYVALKAEEALLNRAEAYALTGELKLALEDVNVWTQNFISPSVKYNTYQYDENWNYIYAEEKIPRKLSLTSIRKWARTYDYYEPWAPRPRKHLHPEFVTLTEGSDQENMLQCILLIRRLEFLHEGMRWFDLKRYGVKIYRRRIMAALNTLELLDSMDYRDERQALQIPYEAQSAGIVPNPRPTSSQADALSQWLNQGKNPEFQLK
ncbi:MAG: RagB/SusD family nutrient uptake outer membrane protein [Bacteroidaceae bacterium]|nr:RagB/SusD family nutrient uptake outer membrane protein [Bacteroidaceae bacterium]